MNKGKNKQTQNYRIVIGTLVIVILFLLFALNEFRIPMIGRKKASEKSSFGDYSGSSGTLSTTQSSTDFMSGEPLLDDAEEHIKEDQEKESMDLEERKRLLSEYSILSNMAESENRKLKISFVRYLDTYEGRKGSADEFFEEWKQRYVNEKDSISREKTETELEREKKTKERARELILESENMTLTDCQQIGDKYGVSLEEVLTLREGQLKVMKYALQTGRSYEYSLDDYVASYAKKKVENINSSKDYNKAFYGRMGIE